tara:strand:+ start:1202 stop:1384 length:183 start_codon:yes stop_codon:yes gene_type:complete
MQVGDTVTSTVTTTNKGLEKGKTYRIVKINEGLTKTIYWVKGKGAGDVQTMAFEEHLTNE